MKISFIGCGKMAQAIIGGILSSGKVNADEMIFSAKSEETVAKVEKQYGVRGTLDNTEAAAQADILFLAIKPDLHGSVIAEIKDVIKKNAIVVTMAAGISIKFIEKSFGFPIRCVRTMPNTPSLVGEGMTAYSVNDFMSGKEIASVKELLSSFGEAEQIEERLMEIIPAISGSSPAYAYLFMEALADGGVKGGLPREKAYRFAAQAMLGAAKMVLETGKHPGELKDQVCTPGGATIEAVAELEKRNFRAAVISAMEKCEEKTRSLSKD